ncbi:MAG: YlmC/YmxH family sporulation protein [Clostridia bacterium]|nr:YlmC/YmxH family sporulation protein [Clostridia bacterium]
MEVSFLDLKEREIINVYDGKKLGRIIDVVFDNRNGIVKGIIVPGDKKIFRKAEDVFIPIDKIKRIGNDVILVGIQSEERYRQTRFERNEDRVSRSFENYYDTYMANSYYQNNKKQSRKQKSKIVYSRGDSSKVEEKESNQIVSYVRLKPLERKKYK